MKLVKHPCYDERKKKDCPDRSMDCHITCKKWREYEQERNAEYDKRKIEAASRPEFGIRQQRAIARRMKRS